MSDEPKATGSESWVQSTAQAVSQIVKEVPIYQDALQPAAQEIGQGIGGLLAWMMGPLQRLGISGRADTAKFKADYVKGLEEIPADRLIPPDPIIMGPTLQALTYTVQEKTLRDMFVKLLVSASDSASKSKAHPAYVEVIKQIAPDEAELLLILSRMTEIPLMQVRHANLAGTGYNPDTHILSISEADNLSYYERAIDNFSRLKIYEPTYAKSIENKTVYEPIIKKIKQRYPGAVSRGNMYSNPESVELNKHFYKEGMLDFTAFGESFIETCVG